MICDKNRELTRLAIPPGFSIVEDTRRLPLSDQYFLISSQGNIRWIIPALPEFGIQILGSWRPYSWSGYLKWRTLLLMYKLRQLRHAPGVEKVGIVNDAQNHKASFVTYIGTPGPQRKSVSVFQNDAIDRFGFVLKKPLGVHAKNAINHEARVLESFSKKNSIAPRLISTDANQGITFQEMIEGSPSGTRVTDAHIGFLGALVQDGGQPCSVINRINKMADLAQSVINYETRNLIFSLLSDFSEMIEVPTVLVHGDFAPWNLKRVEGGKLKGIDWEESVFDGLPLVDLLHFYLKNKFLLGGRFGVGLNGAGWFFDLPGVNKYLDLLKIPTTWRVDVIMLAMIFLVAYFNSRPGEVDHPFGRYLTSVLRAMIQKSI